MQLTTKHRYNRIFNYDMESARKDAPREGMGVWLDEIAIKEARAKFNNPFWHVYRAHLEKDEKTGTTYYHVYLTTV